MIATSLKLTKLAKRCSGMKISLMARSFHFPITSWATQETIRQFCVILRALKSLAYMYNVIKDMLQGTCALIEEVHVRRMKPSATRQIVTVDSLSGEKFGVHGHDMIRASQKRKSLRPRPYRRTIWNI